MTRGIVVLMASCALLAGCGGGDDPVVGDEPITPAAIAAITQEHVDLEPGDITEWDVFTRELGEPSPIDRREGEDVAVQVIGASITDDPRNLDLGVPLEDLAALVTDPRLSLTTSQEVVDLGDSVDLSTP